MLWPARVSHSCLCMCRSGAKPLIFLNMSDWVAAEAATNRGRRVYISNFSSIPSAEVAGPVITSSISFISRSNLCVTGMQTRSMSFMLPFGQHSCQWANLSRNTCGTYLNRQQPGFGGKPCIWAAPLTSLSSILQFTQYAPDLLDLSYKFFNCASSWHRLTVHRRVANRQVV